MPRASRPALRSARRLPASGIPCRQGLGGPGARLEEDAALRLAELLLGPPQEEGRGPSAEQARFPPPPRAPSARTAALPAAGRRAGTERKEPGGLPAAAPGPSRAGGDGCERRFSRGPAGVWVGGRAAVSRCTSCYRVFNR